MASLRPLKLFLPSPNTHTDMLRAVWNEPASEQQQMIESVWRTTDERRLVFAKTIQNSVQIEFEHHSC